MALIEGRLSHVANGRAGRGNVYTEEQRGVMSVERGERAKAVIERWRGYKATPLHNLRELARECGLEKIWYKDESYRFSLKSFKALGGAYAVARQVGSVVEERRGDVTVTCATDGNHGRSVAWGAEMFGCGCVIYVHRDVSEGRIKAIEAFGAEVIRVEGNYDESVAFADREAKKHGWILVSDTSYEGYVEIPKDVALGYTVMVSEAVRELGDEIPSHVFVQGGVGGLASAVCGYLWDLWGEKRPRTVVVEPEKANCLQLSAKEGRPVVVGGSLETLMAGLACGEVSLLAWKILKNGADDFLTLSEDAVAPTMRLLGERYGIEGGESGVVGLAAVLVACGDGEMKKRLGLNGESKVLVWGTEGATDPELYEQLTATRWRGHEMARPRDGEAMR